MGIGASVPGRKPSVHQKLLIAASAGDTHHHKVVDLLALGAMVNTVDGALRTPLHCAAQIGAEDVCALLVTAKADLQMCDKGGRTALQVAETQGHKRVKKLLQKVHDDGEALTAAAQTGNLHQIRQLVQPAAGLSTSSHPGGCAAQAINWRKSDARTPLHHAAEHGHADVVAYLLSVRADVNDEQNRSQFTPLHWAAVRGHANVVEKLVEFKADLAATDMRRDQKAYSALHWAAIRGHNGVIDALLAANADVDMRDSQEQTPLHRAVQFGPSTAVEHLIRSKADVNASDCHRKTPMQMATRPEIKSFFSRSSA